MAAVCAGGSERKRSHAGGKLPLNSPEILHQHDLAINLVYASEENRPAVGRTGKPAPDALCSIYGGDSFHMTGHEIEEIDLRRSCVPVEEVDALFHDPPMA